MSEEEIKFKFSLDAKDALKGMNEMHETISKVGETKNLSGLINSFTALAGPIFIAGAALLAVKKAFDFTLEGEAIQKVHSTFEALAEQSGVSATAIEAGIKKSTRGMVDMVDAMKSANKAMITLGDNANKIPEIMDLGRKAGKIFGVDTLDAFEAINQAIATGNMRSIKQIGLIVDANKAYKTYAASIGVTVSALSEQGKQTALMNAILEKGNEKFKDTGNQIENATGNSKKLGVALTELGETVSEVAAKKFGGFFADISKKLGDMATSVSMAIKHTFGNTVEKSESTFFALNKDITFFKQQLDELKKSGDEDSPNFKAYKDELDKAEAKLSALTEQEEHLQLRKNKKDDSAGVEEEKKKDGGVDPLKVAQEKAAFERQLLQLKESRLNAEMDVETNQAAFEKELDDKKLILKEQYNARIIELRAKAANGDGITAEQAKTEIIQIEEEKTAKLKALDLERQDSALKVYDNQVKAAKTASSGIAAGFAQAGAQATRDLSNYGVQGQKAFGIVNTSSQKFFKGLGEGSKSTSELMKEFLFGALADYAEQQGQVLLASGIGTGNPVAIAEGGGLIALSAIIRGMAGGGGSSSSGGGASGGGYSASPSSGLNQPTLDQTAQAKKSVTIQIQGNYFETEQSKTRLTEMIRESTDATDYKVQQIGVK